MPYGNLDIPTGAPVSSLEPVDAAAERLLDGRGGYCFHLVPPFCALLNSLGFDAKMYRGQVVNHPGMPPEPANPNHAVVLVSGVADAPAQQVLADVGIGDGPRNPVPLQECVFHEPPFAYSMERVDEARWRFVHDPRGGFSHFDIDCAEPVGVKTFVEPHYRLSTLPESIFVQKFTVQRVTDGCIEKVVNRCYRRLSSAGTAEEVIENADRLGALLRETFELSLSDAEILTIWRRLIGSETDVSRKWRKAFESLS